MAIQYSSKNITITEGTLGDFNTLVETIHAWDDAGANINPYTAYANLKAAGAIPVQNTALAGITDTWFSRARLASVDVETLPAAQGVLIRATYMAMEQTRGTGASLYLHLPVAYESSAQPRQAIIYRTGWSVSPPAASDASADIGGSAITGAKDGVLSDVKQIRFNLRATQNATVNPMSSFFTNSQVVIGKRSSATFMGFPAGSVVCEGVTMNPAKNHYYEVTYQFVYDEWYGHDQVVTMDPDGRARQGTSGPTEVKWRRMPRTGYDFNNIYPDATFKAQAERGWYS